MICVHLSSNYGSPSSSPLIIKTLHSNNTLVLPFEKVFTALRIAYPRKQPAFITPGPTRQNKEKTPSFCATNDQNTPFSFKSPGLFFLGFLSSRLSLNFQIKSPTRITECFLHLDRKTLSLRRLFAKLYFDDTFAKSLPRNFFYTLRYCDSPFLQPLATHEQDLRHNVSRRLSPLKLRRSPHTTRPSTSKSTRCREETHTPACSTHSATTNSNARSVVSTV